MVNLIIRGILSKPLTGKPQGSRMGKGSGGYKETIGFIRAGTVFVEIPFSPFFEDEDALYARVAAVAVRLPTRVSLF